MVDADENNFKKYVVEESNSVLIPKIELDNGGDDDFRDRQGIGLNLSKIKSKFRKKMNSKDNNFGQAKKKTGNKRIAILLFILLIIITPLLIEGLLIFRVYQSGIALKDSAEKLMSASKFQNIEEIKNGISNTKSQLDNFSSTYEGVSWLGFLPYFGKYISDGQHLINAGFYGLDSLEIVIEAAEPYADIIGFDGAEENGNADQTAQDKLDFIVKTLPELVPKVDELSEKVALIKKEVDEVSPEDYPKEFSDYEIRENIKKLVDLVDTSSEMIKNAKPLLEASPYLMGVGEEMTYLVIFQNDKELRPTGGFITAYSIARVINGNFDPTTSSDIYNLDNNYTPKIQAPEPIIEYIKGPYVISDKLRLRDMNWSPDFSESMDLLSEEIKSAGIDGLDGIIAVDTQVLVNLLEVLGSVDVPGYGKFSNEIVTECNCPQVIYELESFADIEGPIVWSENEPGKIVYAPENYDNRKKIIGPLMNSILSAVLGQPNEKMPALFEAAIKSLSEKHVLFYLKDEDVQKAIEEFGIGGVLKSYEGDYLFINDANLGGRKSNLYVTQEVLQEVDIAEDGSATKTLTITYKNPEKYDGWLNSVLPNWVRVYVPAGSELISIEGLEEKEDPYEEYGKTVYAGFFELRPQGVAKVVIKYKLPFEVQDRYSVYIQKQPGKDYSLYSFDVDGDQEEMYLRTDKELVFNVN